MKTILKTTFGILAIIAVALAVPAAAVQATFSPVGGTTYYLASSIGSTNTTITLSSFTNRSGIKFTMSNTNTDIMYATVDPQSSNSEFISFTGISQNANGSATLTGVTRGLSDFYPFTASSTLRQPHSGRAPFVLSDAPQVFNQYAVKQNDETVTGDWQGPDPENPQSYATRNYVDSAAFGGIGGASETATGTVQMATASEAAAGTTNGSVGRLALGSNLATSTYNSGTAANVIPVTGAGGLIDPRFIFNGLSYTFPSAQGASSTALLNNGSGALSWNGVNTLLNASSSVGTYANVTSTTTAFSVTVPANVLSNKNAVRVRMPILLDYFQNHTIYISAGYGGTATTTIKLLGPGPVAQYSANLMLEVVLQANNATNAQRLTLWGQPMATSTPYSITPSSAYASSTIAVDATAAQNLTIEVRNEAGGSQSYTTSLAIPELLRQ